MADQDNQTNKNKTLPHVIPVKLLFEFEANIHRYLLQTEVPLVGLKLRSKMGEKGELIKTIWGMGYKFEA